MYVLDRSPLQMRSLKVWSPDLLLSFHSLGEALRRTEVLALMQSILSICSSVDCAVMSAAAAKSLQLCPTLCDPRDGSPSGSPVPGMSCLKKPLSNPSYKDLLFSFRSFII